MIKGLISKLKSKKRKLQSYAAYKNMCDDSVENDEESIDIQVSKIGKNHKIIIGDYISIGDYFNKIKSSDEYLILDSLCNCVLWNSSKQMVNKGTYYVIEVDNHIYNILLQDGAIKIDERTLIEIDEQTGKDNITSERFLSFYIDTCDYRYFSAKHDKTGDTFYTRYYEKNKIPILEGLYLSSSEASDEIKSVLNNIQKLEGIEDILDVSSLLQLLGLDDYNNENSIKNK